MKKIIFFYAILYLHNIYCIDLIISIFKCRKTVSAEKAESIKSDETQKVCAANCLDFLSFPKELESLVKSYLKIKYCLIQTLHTHKSTGNYHSMGVQYSFHDNINHYIYLEYDSDNYLKICNLHKKATYKYNEKFNFLFSPFGAPRAINFNFENFKFPTLPDVIIKNNGNYNVDYAFQRPALAQELANRLSDELREFGKKNWEFLKQELRIEEKENNVFFYAISPDRKFVAVSLLNGEINVWRLNDDENIWDNN